MNNFPFIYNIYHHLARYREHCRLYIISYVTHIGKLRNVACWPKAPLKITKSGRLMTAFSDAAKAQLYAFSSNITVEVDCVPM